MTLHEAGRHPVPYARDDELLESAAPPDDAELPGGQGGPRPREVELPQVRGHQGEEQGDRQPRRSAATTAAVAAVGFFIAGAAAPALEIVADVQNLDVVIAPLSAGEETKEEGQWLTSVPYF